MPSRCSSIHDRAIIGSHTVLITGGCGFIGSHIVEAFAADTLWSSIVAVSRNPTTFCIPGVSYRVCDISDPSQVETLLDNVEPSIIVHTASPGPWASPKAQLNVNYLATKQFLGIARRHRSVLAFIYTSSEEAIDKSSGDGHSRHPLTEFDAKLNSLDVGPNHYARTKGAAASLVLSTNCPQSANGLTTNLTRPNFEHMLLTTVLHIPALYGPRDQTTILPMLKPINTLGTRVQLGNNTALHEWLYADSAALAHVLAAKALLTSHIRSADMRTDGEAFFISDGKPMRFWDFSRKTWTVAGDSNSLKQRSTLKIPFWLVFAIVGIWEWTFWLLSLGGDVPGPTSHHFEFMSRGAWFSIEKARVRLGYEPVCDTEEGIRRTVKWFKDNEQWRRSQHELAKKAT